MSDTLKAVEELLVLLQKHNVRRYRGPIFDAQDKYDLVDLTFTPFEILPVDAPPAVEESTPSKPVDDPELCPCGHSLHAHTNGLCLYACDVEKCGGSDAAVGEE